MQDFIKRQCIGLTGGVATGKSTVANILRGQGYQVFDADQLARAVVEPQRPAFQEIVAAFGRDILTADGALDRKKLAALVFPDPDKRKRLESITHPRIKEEFLIQVSAARSTIGNRWFFYEAALLFEAGQAAEFHEILCTWCPRAIQIQRLMSRNNLSEAEALAILGSQMPADEKRNRSGLVVDTNCSLEELKNRVLHVLPVSAWPVL
jgi:dephospho-CoA kinase